MTRIAPLAFLVIVTLLSPVVQGQDFDVPLARQGVTFLNTYCKHCHGDDDAYPGLDMTDRATLLKPVIEDVKPFLVPGDAEKSRLWRVVGLHQPTQMPPEDQEQPTDEAIAQFERWIKAGAHFPPEARPQREYVAEETVLRMIADDLDKLTDDQIPYTRYFSLAHLWNDTTGSEPTTEEDLRTLRAAVSKLVNSLSNKSRIIVPRVVDREFATLLAIDMRDYGWDEWHWNQVLSQYPYGLKTSSQEATKIYRITGTRIPYLRADWFVHTASRPPVYHALLRIPQNAKALEASLGVHIFENFTRGQLHRAAFQKSGVSDQNRMVERHDTTRGGRYYWKSYDIKPDAGERGDFTRRPLGPPFEGVTGRQLAAFEHDGGEIIYGLPNGLQAYMLVDAKDVRIDVGPADVVNDKNRHSGSFQIFNGISCMGCHKHGMIQWEADEIRPIYEGLRGQKVADKVLELFPPNDEMQALVRKDRVAFMLALQEAVSPYLQQGDDADKSIEDFPDPITKSAKRYLRNVTVEEAARELGIDARELQILATRLPRLRQYGIANFGNDAGSVSRENWEKVYGSISRELGIGTPILAR